MPSKTSKRIRNPRQGFREESLCSEPELRALASRVAEGLRAGDRVLLEGPMGVGKTTFARQLLESLGVLQPPEGSPSFAIAHEYASPNGEVVHLDLYRIKHASEIEEAGIPAYFWERRAIVISEWLSSWPELEEAVLRAADGKLIRIDIEFASEEERRKVVVSRNKRS